MAAEPATQKFKPPFRLTFDGSLVTTTPSEAIGRDLARQTFAALREKNLRSEGRVALRDAEGANVLA